MNIYYIALNTFREALRNKILYSAVLFAAILIGISAFFGAVTIGSQEKVIKDFGLFSLSFFGAAIAILSGVSLLNKELKQKTIYNILSKPVQRWQFIVGKYLGLTATVAVLVSLMGIGLVLFLWPIEGFIDFLLFQAILYTILEVSVVSAVAIFFSAVVVTTTLTGIFTFATYLAGRSIHYLNYFTNNEAASNKPLAFVVSVFDKILPDLSVFNVADAIVYGTSLPLTHLLTAFGYAVGYSVVLLVFASLIFARRELN